MMPLGLTPTKEAAYVAYLFGNHDFAIYTDDGQLLPCDAGTNLLCVKSNNVGSGTADFMNVPQGKFYLVIAADAPDGMTQSSGSVSIAISGTPH